MKIEEHIPLLEEILDERRAALGNEFSGYRNHVYRMVNFCFALGGELAAEEREKIVVAGCFHDIGIWTGATFDYLPPSIEAAEDYLARNDLQPWTPGVALMIDQHHKLRQYAADPLVEIFRKGDLVDFSLGVFKCGLPRPFIKSVKKQFPNAGFHKFLASFAGRWICRHPLNPLPVAKW